MLKSGDKLKFRFRNNMSSTFDKYFLDDHNFFFTKEDPGMYNYLPHWISISEERKFKLNKITECYKI